MNSKRWLAGLVSSLSLGCGDGDSTSVPEQDTLVVVSPDDFLGDVACADWPGAMRRYVATLIDVTDELVDAGSRVEAFALPSSGPVDCRYPVGFGRVAVGHRYAARIEGYDRVDLTPAAPGSPTLLDGAEGAVVPPRWRTECGRAGALGSQGPVSPIKLRSAFVTGCKPLDAGARPPLAAVTIKLDTALGALSCSADGGAVERYQVLMPDSTEVRAAECDADVQFVALTPGALVAFEVSAFGPGDETARWTTSCWALPEAGTLVEARCDVLSERKID